MIFCSFLPYMVVVRPYMVKIGSEYHLSPSTALNYPWDVYWSGHTEDHGPGMCVHARAALANTQELHKILS